MDEDVVGAVIGANETEPIVRFEPLDASGGHVGPPCSGAATAEGSKATTAGAGTCQSEPSARTIIDDNNRAIGMSASRCRTARLAGRSQQREDPGVAIDFPLVDDLDLVEANEPRQSPQTLR